MAPRIPRLGLILPVVQYCLFLTVLSLSILMLPSVVADAQVRFIGEATDARGAVQGYALEQNSIQVTTVLLGALAQSPRGANVVGQFIKGSPNVVLGVERAGVSTIKFRASGIQAAAVNEVDLKQQLGARLQILTGFDLAHDGVHDVAIIDTTGEKYRWFVIENPLDSKPRISGPFILGRSGDHLEWYYSPRRVAHFAAVSHRLNTKTVTVRSLSPINGKRQTFARAWRNTIGEIIPIRLARSRRNTPALAILSPQRRILYTLKTRRGFFRHSMPVRRCQGVQLLSGAILPRDINTFEVCPDGTYLAAQFTTRGPTIGKLLLGAGSLPSPRLVLRRADQTVIDTTVGELPVPLPIIAPGEPPDENGTFPEPTGTPGSPTAVPSVAPTSLLPTAVASPTGTSVVTPTHTSAPVLTETPGNTATSITSHTATPSTTHTAVPTDTASPTPTATSTNTPIPIPFVFSVDTTLTSTGSSNSNQFTLPLVPGGQYNFTVHWGDGSQSVVTSYSDSARTHTYSSPGTYTVTVYGQLHGWRFDNQGDKLKLGNISQWGNQFRLAPSGGSAPTTYSLASNEGEIEALTVVGGYVWAGTNTAPGKLIRYNPTGGTHTTTSLEAGEDYIYGMTTDGTSVYAVDWDAASNIIRFDAASGARIAAYPTGVSNLFSMTFDGTYVWAASDGGAAKLVRFDPATAQVTVYDITGATGGWSIVSVGDVIYGVSGTVLFRFNKATLATDTVTLSGVSSAKGIAFDGANLWVSTDQSPVRLLKVNPNTLAFETTTMPSEMKNSEALIFDGTYLWSTTKSADVSSLLKIPITDIGAATIVPLSIAANATQALAFDGSKVWTASYTAPSAIFGVGKSYWPSDGYFYGCSNMSVSATDAPDMTGVTSMANAFRGCGNFNTDIGHWDVSGVELFDNMLRDAVSFSNGAGLRAEPYDPYPAASAAQLSVSAGYYNGLRLNVVQTGSPSLYYYYHGSSTASVSNSSGKLMLSYGPDFPNLTRVRVSTTGTMPGGLAADTDYWVIRQQYAAWGDKRPAGLLAASLADAQAGAAINYSTAGTGVLTIFDATDTGWQVSSPHSQYWTKFYDDGTQMRLVTTDYWSVRWFYRELSPTGSRVYYVSGTGEYATSGEAEAEAQRTDLPAKITNECVLVAKAVVKRDWRPDWKISLENVFSSIISSSGYIGGTSSINNWNVSQAKSMAGMFRGATTFRQPLSTWDVGRVANFSNMFSGAYAFDSDLTGWNTSNGILFNGMFSGARLFNNGDPANNGAKSLPWNVAKGTDFSDMFNGAWSFNQHISGWDMRNATSIRSMFAYSIFNNGDAANSQSKPLTWYLPKVVDATYIFYRSFHPFNQDIGTWFAPQNGDVMQVSDLTHGLCHRAGDNGSIFNNGGSPNINNWRTPNLTSMRQVLANCNQFNQPIGNWDVSSVTNMEGALLGTSSFNQDLSSWNTGNVTDMRYLFSNATVFNNGESAGSSSRPLLWNVSNVTDFGSNIGLGMFSGARSFNQDISSWDTSSATSMGFMFYGASSFNQDISSWDVSNVTYFAEMFNGAVSFKRSLSAWTPSAATNFDKMFATTDINTPGTTDNYDNFLLKVANVTNQDTRTLSGGSSRYSFAGLGSAASSTGRAYLTTATSATPNAGRGWTITDGGTADCTFSSSSGLLVTYAGDRPTFSRIVFKTNGTLPTGLTAGTPYWTVRVSATTARLASSLADAQAGTVVPFVDSGSGAHAVMNVGHVFTATSSSGNVLVSLTAGGDLNFSGRRVRFVTTGTLPAGLSAGTDYFLNRVSATTYRVTTRAVDAVTAANFVAFSDSGTGTHELVLQ